MRDPEDPVKDAAPGIVLRAEKMDPAVKSGDSDLPDHKNPPQYQNG